MLLLLQIAVILAFARLLGRAVLAVGQPLVIGEMAAGFLLGPSGFGWLTPHWAGALFPASSLSALNALSQMGLVLFMFIVGLRVSTHRATANRRAVVVTSVVSIVVPFIFGTAIGFLLHDGLSPTPVGVWPFALFVGTSLSITAFPVLARILDDYQLLDTDLGRFAITCAACDDVTGWLILAGVLSIVHAGTAQQFVIRLLLFGAYVAFMSGVVRPVLAWMERRAGGALAEGGGGLSFVLIVTMISAVATEALGVHALFGAFVAGLVMPAGVKSERGVIGRIEPLVTGLMLPLFFASTGLSTSVRLINSPALFAATAIVVATAIVGKGGAASLTSWLMGLPSREALQLGALLNTRGLIELVILSVGLQQGILSPLAFSILVTMTFVTTVMTAPLLRWLRRT